MKSIKPSPYNWNNLIIPHIFGSSSVFLLCIDNSKIMCILRIAIQYSVETFGYGNGTEGGGLSGEHIQLCAEGARRKPNLSGKRTEML
jgi:hypothetical protein